MEQAAMPNMTPAPKVLKPDKRESLWRNFKRRKMLYFMCIPGILIYLVFAYVPMYGIIVAFLNYNPYSGLAGIFDRSISPWVGWQWFDIFINQRAFWPITRNTLMISFYGLIWGFPMPIILAILFNEVRNAPFKRVAQTISYLPHFLSWAIMGGLVISFLSPNNGSLNSMLMSLGLLKEPIQWVVQPQYFRTILVVSSIWKGVGWGTIIYLAAIVGIDPALYEAAVMDGAGKFRQILNITLPGITPVISISLILAVGGMMGANFEQIYMLMTPNTQAVGDVYETFTYRIGIQRAQFSLTTAAGLFKNVVNSILLITANFFSKKVSGTGIW